MRMFVRLCLLLVVSVPSWSATPVIVDTPLGEIEGEFDETANVNVFRGIPFARVAKRFQPSTLVGAWKPEVLKAISAGPACQQDTKAAEPYFLDPGTPISEDCLLLNIWAPHSPPVPGKEYPVMVYIHGGAWNYGGASSALFEGATLAAGRESAKDGVIVVTVQYRLGLFGFLQSPELAAEDPSGSYGGMNGIADQINALRFIQTVIPALGGNPDAVTVFGESAGGTSVCMLLVIPSAKGLFARAIIESGNCIMEGFGPAGRKQGIAMSAAAMKKLGAKNVADLRALPAKKLTEAFGKPSVDGVLLTEHPRELFADKKFILDPAEKPNVIIGTNSYDCHGPVFFPFIEKTKYKPMIGMKSGQLGAMLTQYFGDAAGKIAGFYDKTLSPFLTFANVNADTCLHCGLRRMASLLGEVYPTFFYYYSYNPAPDIYGQAGHASELTNVFGNDIALTKWWVYNKAVSSRIQAYWRQAARNELASQSAADWPAFDSEKKTNYLVIEPSGEIRSEVTGAFLPRCNFWLSLWSKDRQKLNDFCNVVKGRPD